MLQVTVLRVCLMITLGVVLFLGLLYISGCVESRYLRKRSKRQGFKQEKQKARIFLYYLIVLVLGISLSFLLITFKIRGVR